MILREGCAYIFVRRQSRRTASLKKSGAYDEIRQISPKYVVINSKIEYIIEVKECL